MTRWWRRRSLQARLTLVASVTVALGLLAGAATLGLAVTRSRTAELDTAIRARAELVAQLARTDRLPAVLPADPGSGELVEVVDNANEVLAGSLTTSRTLALLDPEQLAGWPRNAPRSYDDERLTGDRLRVVLLDADLAGRPVTVVAAVPLRGVADTLSALRRTSAAAVPLLLLAAAAGSWLLAGSALRPVEALRRGAERIGEHGGGGGLPVPAGFDEVARLARTLNRMLDRLASAGDRQRVFLADAAHELRSPLTSLRAALEVAVAHPREPAERALAADLLPDVLRLGRLVDDLLTLARLDEGAASTQRATLDLAAVAREVVAGVGQRSGDPSVAGSGSVAGEVSGVGDARYGGGPSVSVSVSGAGEAYADPQSVRRIVRNLLDNAYRHAASFIAVTVAPGTLTVADDGAGVPSTDRDRIFERFTRLDDARTRDVGGSGLGLAIARESARADGGDLTVEPVGPSGGATFRLTLPAGPGARPPTGHPTGPQTGPEQVRTRPLSADGS